MSQVIPGLSGFPMDVATMLHSQDMEVAEKTVSDIIEPRHFVYSDPGATPDIRISHVEMSAGHLFGVRHGASIHVMSDPIRSFQVMVPLRGALRGRSTKSPIVVGPGTALIYSPSDSLDTYWSDDCIALVLSLEAEKLAGLLRQVSPASEFRALRLHRQLDLNTGCGRSFANVLGTICHECTDKGSAFRRGFTARILEEALLLSLLSAGLGELPRLPHRANLSRQTYIARTVEFIEAHCDDEIGATDLVQASGASLRSLQLGFYERFGVGPMTYLKQVRLRRVHEDLLAAQPGHETVGDIAARWGFYNGSAFAKIYKQFFGVLPSQTLGRAVS